MTPAKSSRTPLTADDWSAAALAALERNGLAAVAVEPIAKTLGATKGSFYWHFSGRDDLVSAALALWERRDTDGVIAAIDRARDDDDRLRLLLRIVLSAVVASPGAGAIELALQPHASHPLVAPVLARVTRRRMSTLEALYAERGLTSDEARDRALLAYTAYLGHAQLAHATPDRLPKGTAFTAYVDRVVESLAA
ncbi:TetR/AcrR family transcriptional regulator [Aeromicrobium sp. NPDC092404]|uniref:TetR/AcrR family transcriptional regulator n=1 Tax=Aeromicrobium sp. NPDC092404 TaxID=3154976 RepID=UPI003444C245